MQNQSRRRFLQAAFGPSVFSSLRSWTVTAGPANLFGNNGRMSCDMYSFLPYNCSMASETEATSTVLNP